MALRDYILCKRCECKMAYDGHDEARDYLEEKWGDPEAPTFTPLLLCPDCIHALEDQNKGLLEALNYFFMRDPDKPTCWEYKREQAEALARAALEPVEKVTAKGEE